jgi:hypothetical protein
MAGFPSIGELKEVTFRKHCVAYFVRAALASLALIEILQSYGRRAAWSSVANSSPAVSRSPGHGLFRGPRTIEAGAGRSTESIPCDADARRKPRRRKTNCTVRLTHLDFVAHGVPDADPAHRRRANGVRLSTETRSRRSVQPAGWARE